MHEDAGAARRRPRRRRRVRSLVLTLAAVVAVLMAIDSWVPDPPPLVPLEQAARSCDGEPGLLTTSPASCALPGRMAALRSYWAPRLAQVADDTEPLRVLVYRGSADSSCGSADERDEAFYCAPDDAVYLDLDAVDFYDGEWGPAPTTWLLAHEWAHHVQDALDPDLLASEDVAVSTRLELQADCLAGVAMAALRHRFTDAEIDDVLQMAEAFGDDAADPGPSGPGEDPGEVSHGTGRQRVEAVERGLAGGRPADCSGPVDTRGL